MAAAFCVLLLQIIRSAAILKFDQTFPLIEIAERNKLNGKHPSKYRVLKRFLVLEKWPFYCGRPCPTNQLELVGLKFWLPEVHIGNSEELP